jgi:ceramide glucosyltransferase
MPIGARPHTFWAEVECAFLNTLQARYQYISESLGLGFAQGKTMLFRRDILERAGGLTALAQDNAEDAAATKLVRAAGLRVHLVDRPFEQPLGRRTATEVWLRQLRWARLRRTSFWYLYLPETLVGSLFPAIAAGVAAADCGLSVLLVVGLVLALWVGAEMALAARLGWRCSWRLAAALLLRDLLLPALWLGGVLGSGFTWRGSEISARQPRHKLSAALRRRFAGETTSPDKLSAAGPA